MATHEKPEHIAPQDWDAVQELIHELQRAEACQVFAKRLFQWDLTVKFFRRTEDRRITLGDPTEDDLHFHAMCLNNLLAIGNALVVQSKGFSPDDLIGFDVTHEQIKAYVEELTQSYREWHHGFTPDELSKVKSRIFIGAP